MPPEHKCVKSSHVSEVVQFGHVGKHVVEVVGIRGVLALGPPSFNRFQSLSRNNFQCETFTSLSTCLELARRCQTLHSQVLIHRPHCQSQSHAVLNIINMNLC